MINIKILKLNSLYAMQWVRRLSIRLKQKIWVIALKMKQRSCLRHRWINFSERITLTNFWHIHSKILRFLVTRHPPLIHYYYNITQHNFLNKILLHHIMQVIYRFIQLTVPLMRLKFHGANLTVFLIILLISIIFLQTIVGQWHYWSFLN